MKVILKKEVAELGSYGDQIKVAAGYARNFLIPKGMAVEVSPGNLRQFEAEKEAYLKKEQIVTDDAHKRKDALEALSLSFTRKVGEEEKLFGSVTVHDIEVELKSRGFEVERKDIHLPEPIKTTGEFKATVKLHHQVSAEVKLAVTAEE